MNVRAKRPKVWRNSCVYVGMNSRCKRAFRLTKMDMQNVVPVQFICGYREFPTHFRLFPFARFQNMYYFCIVKQYNDLIDKIK